MTNRPQSLLGAGQRRVREDRLTDYLAICAERNLRFAKGLLGMADLSEPVNSVRVYTQTWTPRGRRVDLEIVGVGHDRAEVCRLWVENKVGAAYQPEQLSDYREDLWAWKARSALLTIVERGTAVARGDWSVGTWNQVADLGAGVLREMLGDSWRASAWRADTPAEALVLRELLVYLDKEHGVVSDPLKTEDVLCFRLVADAYRALDSLLARAAELSGEPLSRGVAWSDDLDSAWVVFEASDSWWKPYGGMPEMHLADRDDYFGTSRRGEPGVGVGVNLPVGYGDTIYATHPEWVAHLRAAGYDPYQDDAWVRLYKTVYLAEVLAAGVTLEEQAEFLAGHLRGALDFLRSAEPPSPLEAPPSRGRRPRQASATAADGSD